MTVKASIPDLCYLTFRHWNGSDTCMLDNACLLVRAKDFGEDDGVELSNKSERGLVF